MPEGDAMPADSHITEMARLEALIGQIASELRHDLRNVQQRTDLFHSTQQRDDIRITRMERFATVQEEWNGTVSETLKNMGQWTIPDGFEDTIKRVVMDAQHDAENRRWEHIRHYWWLITLIATLLGAAAGPNVIAALHALSGG